MPPEVANSAECLAGLKQHIASSAANPCFPLRGRPAQRERVYKASAEMILYAELTAARQHSAVRFEGSLSLAP